jgi:hypothetical protein
MTCAACLVSHDDFIDAWVKNNQHAEWVKTVSDPAHEMTELDEKLTEALLRHNR